MLPLVRLVVALSLVAVLTAACGGNGDDGAAPAPPDTGPAPGETLPQPGADDAELEREANRIEGIIENRVRALTDARSTDDLSREVGEARRELEAAADDVGELDVSPAREDARADLEESTRRLVSELAEVEREAGAGNLVSAAREAASLDSLPELESALRRARDG